MAGRGGFDRRWITLSVTTIGTFMSILDSTIVNIALPSILRDFHANLDSGQLVPNGPVGQPDRTRADPDLGPAPVGRAEDAPALLDVGGAQETTTRLVMYSHNNTSAWECCRLISVTGGCRLAGGRDPASGRGWPKTMWSRRS